MGWSLSHCGFGSLENFEHLSFGSRIVAHIKEFSDVVEALEMAGVDIALSDAALCPYRLLSLVVAFNRGWQLLSIA